MKFALQKPAMHKFRSVPHLYQGTDEPEDLLLEIHEYGADALEVKLSNAKLRQQKATMKNHILFFMLVSGLYVWIHLHKIFHLAHVEILLVLWFIVLIWRLSNIVEFEKFLLCYDFGIHLHTQRFLGKSSTFVASSNIHDIRINEVIENLDFRYLLIIRTKGRLFHTNPIIPMFTVFKPSCDCLNLIYKHLNKVLIKEASSSSYSSQQL